MAGTTLDADAIMARATSQTHQEGHELQPYGHHVAMPIALSAAEARESVANLNQILADTITLRDMYKKHHWQIDVAETTLIPRPSRGRQAAPQQIARLLHAHEIVLKEARTMAKIAAAGGDDGTNDLLVSDVIRRNELQVWFLSQHVVAAPL